MELFKIGDTDYTNCIVMPTYKVNNEPVYEDWEDANYHRHRCIARYRLTGSFTVWFEDENKFHSFMAALSPSLNNQAEGYVVADVFAVNENLVHTAVKVFIKASPSQTVPYFGKKAYDGFEVTIEDSYKEQE